MILSSLLAYARVPKAQRPLLKAIVKMTGIRPRDPFIYLAAFRRKHKNGNQHSANLSYERLEYLGDAVLGVLLAEYLFEKYPKGNEGYLTSMRSKVVSRKALNRIAEKMGISKWMENTRRGRGRHQQTSVPGNTLEALVGAVYSDRGWKATRTFVYRNILDRHVNFKSVEREVISYKSLLIEWSQRKKKRFEFDLTEENGSENRRRFVFSLKIEGEEVATGSGPSKKSAEESAARAACKKLRINRNGRQSSSRSRPPRRKREA